MNINHLFQHRPNTFNSCHRDDLVDGFGKWIKQYFKDGWDTYLLTFMFNQLPGSQETQRDQMHEEITAVYSKLVTRVVRKPKSHKNTDFLPRGVFFLDKPAQKRQKQRIREVQVNDGLHMHGIVVLPPKTRLKVGLEKHFREHRSLYETPKLYRIHVQPIDHSPVHTTGYAGKALKSRGCTEDDVLILPRSISELTQSRPLPNNARNIRDIQSRFNVSDEVARAFLAKNRRIK
jgi:hypothetical protein